MIMFKDRASELMSMVTSGEKSLEAAAQELGCGVSVLVAKLRSKRRPVIVEVDEEDEGDSLPAAIVTPAVMPKYGGWRLLEMGARQCRWPTAETPTGSHLFCGRPTAFRCWCSKHQKLAYTTPRTNLSAVRAHWRDG